MLAVYESVVPANIRNAIKLAWQCLILQFYFFFYLFFNTISHSMVKTPIEDKLSYQSNSIIPMEMQ